MLVWCGVFWENYRAASVNFALFVHFLSCICFIIALRQNSWIVLGWIHGGHWTRVGWTNDWFGPFWWWVLWSMRLTDFWRTCTYQSLLLVCLYDLAASRKEIVCHFASLHKSFFLVFQKYSQMSRFLCSHLRHHFTTYPFFVGCSLAFFVHDFLIFF